ncbi:MAG: hypothetical protein OEU54_12310 [Gemmatimonadota bacterium]|nr:hypothetical protein [Gemmatimonadota bacterium]
MTYEDRVKHRELLERSASLAERLGEGEGWAPVTRDEARELSTLIDEVLAQLSPERWDRLMEAIVDEATRRAGSLAPSR